MKVRVAVHQALRENGMNILHVASAFREAVCSGLDDESTVPKLLATGSDDEFVRSFSTAVEARSSDDLVEASECATRHLVKAYALDAEVAASVRPAAVLFQLKVYAVEDHMGCSCAGT